MHVLLLDAWGYSLVEYLDSLDLKFRNMVLSLLWNTLHTGNINLKSYTAENTAQALLGVISGTGPPLAVLSDQGPNFMSKVMLLLYKKLGISRVRASPYHPQSNGRLERFHATLKTMLIKFIHNKHDWPAARWKL